MAIVELEGPRLQSHLEGEEASRASEEVEAYLELQGVGVEVAVHQEHQVKVGVEEASCPLDRAEVEEAEVLACQVKEGAAGVVASKFGQVVVGAAGVEA